MRAWYSSYTVRRAVLGAVLGVGAPAGWALLQQLRGNSAIADVAAQPGLYAYMLVATIIVFALFGAVLGHHEERALRAAHRLKELSVTDALTGLRNDRYFFSRVREELAHAHRVDEPLALLLIDLDHFKRVNDRYGHPAGDEVLVHIARALQSVAREEEPAARIGGEEFALLLSNCQYEEAHQVGERLRSTVEETEVSIPGRDESIRVTTSVGIALSVDEGIERPEDLYMAADKALYRAKHQGRNRVVLYDSAKESNKSS